MMVMMTSNDVGGGGDEGDNRHLILMYVRYLCCSYMDTSKRK